MAIGIGSLIAGWFIYDFLCDSALGKRPALLGFVLFVLLVAAAFGLSKVFSGRGAYLHVGAIIGTIMVGNVFRTIMPAQRALVAAIKEGRSPDPALPAKGLLRSRHNNYFTLRIKEVNPRCSRCCSDLSTQVLRVFINRGELCRTYRHGGYSAA